VKLDCQLHVIAAAPFVVTDSFVALLRFGAFESAALMNKFTGELCFSAFTDICVSFFPWSLLAARTNFGPLRLLQSFNGNSIFLGGVRLVSLLPTTATTTLACLMGSFPSGAAGVLFES